MMNVPRPTWYGQPDIRHTRRLRRRDLNVVTSFPGEMKPKFHGAAWIADTAHERVGSGVGSGNGFEIQHAVLWIHNLRDELHADIGHDVALRVPGNDFEVGQLSHGNFGEAELGDGIRCICHSTFTSVSSSSVSGSADE